MTWTETKHSKGTVLAGSIISIFPGLTWIGDFIVGSKAAYLLGSLILIFSILTVTIMILAVSNTTVVNNNFVNREMHVVTNKSSYSETALLLITVCSLITFGLYICSIVFNFNSYSTKQNN
jgi:hypothetical protein